MPVCVFFAGLVLLAAISNPPMASTRGMKGGESRQPIPALIQFEDVTPHSPSAPCEAAHAGGSEMKMIMFFRRKAGMSPEEFRSYYELEHAPLAVELFPYFRDYRRNYIRHDQRHRRTTGQENDRMSDFDVITELTFNSRFDYDRMMREMQDPDIRRQVVEDELRFMDRDATVVILVDEEITDLDCNSS